MTAKHGVAVRLAAPLAVGSRPLRPFCAAVQLADWRGAARLVAGGTAGTHSGGRSFGQCVARLALHLPLCAEAG